MHEQTTPAVLFAFGADTNQLQTVNKRSQTRDP